jgi:uncharacterized membrane protein (DUF485 family)
VSTTDQGPPGSGPDWETIQQSAEFTQLRRRLRNFVFPMTIAFLAWYLLYVLLSDYAHDFMSTKVFGNVNVALIFGLLQFVTTFALAWVYARYSNARLDPLAKSLDEQYAAGLNNGGKI